VSIEYLGIPKKMTTGSRSPAVISWVFYLPLLPVLVFSFLFQDSRLLDFFVYLFDIKRNYILLSKKALIL